MAAGTAPADYAQLVIDHFNHPRNAGRFAPADDVIEAEAGSVAQGALFHLSARIERDRIAAVRFEAYGCPHCIAAASWLSERLRAVAVDELDRWNWREVAQALAVPAEKRGRLLILEDTVRHLAEAWRRSA